MKAIDEVVPSTTKTELQSLPSKINFVRRFISNLSERVLPFSPLLKLKNDQEFKWSDVQQKAFEEIKEYIKCPPVLVPPQQVVSKADVIKHMLSMPILNGRMGKWILALSEFDLRYESAKVVKWQVIADFVTHHHKPSIGYVELIPWTLFFDGSSCKQGGGIGIVIVSPRGQVLSLLFQLNQ